MKCAVFILGHFHDVAKQTHINIFKLVIGGSQESPHQFMSVTHTTMLNLSPIGCSYRGKKKHSRIIRGPLCVHSVIYHRFMKKLGVGIQNQSAGEDEILHTSLWVLNIASCQFSAR